MKANILISFPRSGAHWFKALLNLHEPRLAQGLLHSHDNHLQIDLSLKSAFETDNPVDRKIVERFLGEESLVIYGYREPVAVMFSMSEYYRPFIDTQGRKIIPSHWPEEPKELEPRLEFWMEKWNSNLSSWLAGENSTHVDVFFRYPEIPEGARQTLVLNGLEVEEDKLIASKALVKSYIEAVSVSMSPFDRARILEAEGERKRERKQEFYQRWQSAIEQMKTVSLDRVS